MRTKRSDRSVSELETASVHRALGSGDAKSRRLRSILTYLTIFLACILVSTCIWLVVHYVNDRPSGQTAGASLAISGELSQRLL